MTTVKIQFRAEHLDKKDFFGLGKSDPYLIIEKKTGDSENATYQQIHKTEYIKNDCSPTWKPFHLTFEEENPDLKVKVYDWDKLSEHDFIGECETNLSDLLTGSEIKFECKKEKKTGKIKNAGSIILMYCRRAVGMKLSFRLNLETTTSKNLFLVVTERFQNGAKIDEEIYRSETIKTSSEGQGEWKLIETAVEDVQDTLQVQVFKSHQHSEPELYGDFLVELATLLYAEAGFEDRKFDLNRKGKKEKTGQVTLAMCKLCNLPTSVSAVLRDSKPAAPHLRRAPPPPSTAPPPPPPPPPPPTATKKSRDHLQKASNISANPPQAKGTTLGIQMDELLKKKLKPVQTKGEDSTTGIDMNEILKKKLKPVQSKGVETVESAPKPKLAKKPSMTNVLEIMRKAKGFEEEGNDESGEWDAEIQDLPPPPPLPATNPPKRMKLKDGPEMELSG